VRIAMRFYISGGRHDGRDWPEPGVPIEVPGWEGEDLVRGGLAVRLATPDSPAPAPGTPPPPHQQLPGQPSPQEAGHAQTDAGQAAEAAQPDGTASREAAAAAEPEGAPAGNEAGGSPDEPGGPAAEPLVAAANPSPAAPGPSATKQAWIDHAVTAHGAELQEAQSMTKADLMSRYGGRL